MPYGLPSDTRPHRVPGATSVHVARRTSSEGASTATWRAGWAVGGQDVKATQYGSRPAVTTQNGPRAFGRCGVEQVPEQKVSEHLTSHQCHDTGILMATRRWQQLARLG